MDCFSFLFCLSDPVPGNDKDHILGLEINFFKGLVQCNIIGTFWYKLVLTLQRWLPLGNEDSLK